mmetsp:Transcript_18474/g.56739  ORF Transcript_18474/g.56739 Transcript_18474/m.56739 type:complete len:238 (-) Transcript_18474:353-1066(-)
MMSRDVEQNRSSMSTMFSEGAAPFFFQAGHCAKDAETLLVVSALLRKSSTRTSVQSWNVANVWSSHLRWNPGAITRRRRFQTSGSAGMRPWPRIGFRISDRMPLSKFSDLSFRTCFAIAGSATTMNDRGPNASLNTGPTSRWYFVNNRKRGPPTIVWRSPVTSDFDSLNGPCSRNAARQSQDATGAWSSLSLPSKNCSRLFNKMRKASTPPGLAPGYVEPAYRRYVESGFSSMKRRQ